MLIGSGATPYNSAVRQSDEHSELSVLIANYLRQSPSYYQTDLMSSISQNLDCYNGNPFRSTGALGEQSGDSSQSLPPDKNRSTYQSNDVCDIVELAMPGLMKPFTSSEEIAIFEPTSPGKEQMAKQQQDLANYNFFKENPGFLLLENTFRNALICKVGIIHVYWFEGEEYSEREYSELNDKKFFELYDSEDMDLIGKDEVKESQEMGPDGSPVMMKYHSGKFRHTRKVAQLKYESILPENFFVSNDQFSLSLNDPTRKCTFCAERIYMAREGLLDIGVPEERIDKLPTYTQSNQTGVQLSRYYRSEQSQIFNGSADNFNPERQVVEVFKCYVRYDSDDDGRTELHRVYYSNQIVLLDEIVEDYIPYFALTPITQPGQFYGLCPADLARPVQLNATSLVRAMLDNFYFNTVPIMGVNENMVDTSARNSIANRVPGGYFMVDGDPAAAIMSYPPTYTGDSTLKLLSYFDDQRDSRTGISKMMAGLDANILSNNKGDITANRIMTASEDRLALIAKNFAETGLKEMFYYATSIMMQHENRERKLRLREEFVDVDPRTWDAPQDITIKIGIGTNDEIKKIQALNAVLQNYAQLYQIGAFGTAFNQNNVYLTLKDQASAMGLKFPEKYYLDPNSQEAKDFAQQQSQQKQNQPPSVQDQALMAQAKIDEERNQLTREKQQADMAFKQRDLALKEQELHLKTLQGANQMHNSLEDNALKATDLQLKYHPNNKIPGALAT